MRPSARLTQAGCPPRAEAALLEAVLPHSGAGARNVPCPLDIDPPLHHLVSVRLAEGHVEAEAVEDAAAQNFELNFAHELHVDLPVALVPDDAQHRVLFFKLAELYKRAVRVRTVG